MIDNKKVLAIIPARGGSKRLPRKNILPFGGKPLIAWTIDTAKQCKYIDRVIVSTEDSEIARVSEQAGADIPFIRPTNLAADNKTTMDVVLHLIDKLEEQGESYDYVVMLQPTSPLRTAKHLNEAFEQLITTKKSAIVSVCKSENHPFWSNTLPENKAMSSFLRNGIKNRRSQELPAYYRLNGAVYICDVGILKIEKTFVTSKDCSAYVMEQEESIDIDTKDDFDRAHLAVDKNIIEKAKLLDQFLDDFKQSRLQERSKSELESLIIELFIKHYSLEAGRSTLKNELITGLQTESDLIEGLAAEIKIENKLLLDLIRNIRPT